MHFSQSIATSFGLTSAPSKAETENHTAKKTEDTPKIP